MNTKPEDVSSTVLPSSPQAGASVTYCLQKRNIEGSADQSHHLVNKKEKIRGKRLKWEREPGCTPSPTSTVPWDIQPHQGPSREGTQAWGYITQTTHCRAVRLARRHQIQHGPPETASGKPGNGQRQDSSQGEGPPSKTTIKECRVLYRSEWEVGGWDGPGHPMLSLGSYLLSAMTSFQGSWLLLGRKKRSKGRGC